jgi:hypothetical protein
MPLRREACRGHTADVAEPEHADSRAAHASLAQVEVSTYSENNGAPSVVKCKLDQNLVAIRKSCA